MKICIIGGRLQGTEACYLARACGMYSILTDIDPEAPASGLCDKFAAGDLIKEEPEAVSAFREADIILPANENDELLDKIAELAERYHKPLAFDPEAYEITRSKIRSDRLFLENGIPCPKYFPKGRSPYVVKPSDGSGSAGVKKLNTREEAETFYRNKAEGDILQEYLEGPSYSIEVIGKPGNYRTYTVTEVHVDKDYDCNMITSPVMLSEAKRRRLSDIAVRLAELVKLKGIMDVEVIDDGEDLKVLEIDARIPSQTPIAVLKSSGMNLLKELADVTLYGDFRDENTAGGGEKIFCAYENYRRSGGLITSEGEHIMRNAKPLTFRENFLGSMESMTDYRDSEADFRGIFINWGVDKEEVLNWRNILLHSQKD